MVSNSAARVAPPPVRRRRRAFPIVDPRFQWKYTALFVFLGVGVATVMGAFWHGARLDSTRLLELGGDERLLQEVVQSDRMFLLGLGAVLVLMALVLVAWGVIVTHRISGPLHIVARYLSVIAQGYYPDVRPLRKHDELQDFFASFEEAVRTMRARQKANLRDLDAAIAAANGALSENAEQGLKQAIDVLEQQRSILARGLAVSADLEESEGS